jgi:hypothetical protein
VSERFADGLEVQAADARALEAVETMPAGTDSRLAAEVASFAVLLPAKQHSWDQMGFARHVSGWVRVLLHLPPDANEFLAHCDLLRDLFGNPFRPSTSDPAWRTPDAVELAQAAYDERHLPAGTLDAALLAVLADALEEAGCSDGAMLSHLRGPGTHVRGCWVVDLILNRG